MIKKNEHQDFFDRQASGGSWSFNREVRLGEIITILIILSGFILGYSELKHAQEINRADIEQLKNIKADKAVYNIDIIAIKNGLNEIKSTINEIDEKVDRLRISDSAIRERIRDKK